MKTIPLRTHELSVEDYSFFALEVYRRAAVLEAVVETYATPQGTLYARLTEPAVSFDESQTDTGDLRKLVQAYGFETTNLS